MGTIFEMDEGIIFARLENSKHGVIDQEIDGVLSPMIEDAHAGTLLNCFNQFLHRGL